VSDDGEEFEVSYREGSREGERSIIFSYEEQPIGRVDFRIDTKLGTAILDYANDGRNRYVGIEVDKFFSQNYSGIGTALMGLAFRVARHEEIPEFFVLNSEVDDFYRSLGMIEMRDGVFRFPLEESEMEKNHLSLPSLKIHARSPSDPPAKQDGSVPRIARAEIRSFKLLEKWKEKIAELKEDADYQLLRYLLKNTGLSDIEKNRYLALWLMMAISAPLTGSLKFVFAAAATSLAVMSPWFLALPPLVVLLLSPLFRIVFFIGPFWIASGFAMKLDWLIPVNFTPGLGAFLAVPAQILRSLSGEYRKHRGMSVKKLRDLVRELEVIFSKHRMDLADDIAHEIKLRLPGMAFAILDFQAAHPELSFSNKNTKADPEAYINLETTDLSQFRLETLVQKNIHTIFFSADEDQFNALAEKIQKMEAGPLHFYRFELDGFRSVFDDAREPARKLDATPFIRPLVVEVP
jgi:hypothetical protein